MSETIEEEVVALIDVDLTDDNELMMKAVDFVMESVKGNICPLCTKPFGFEDDGDQPIRNRGLRQPEHAARHRGAAAQVRVELPSVGAA